MSTSKSAAAPEPSPFLGQRLVSLDQFRGYTVAGMFLVNFLGKFDACPEVLKHHNTYNSYADTIMPGFFFAVGFAFRLTFGRRAQSMGVSAAYWRVVRRFVGLGLFAIIFYGAGGSERAKTWEALRELGIWDAVKDPLKRDWFQTLLHIAVTCLWLTPVIRAGALVRTLYMLGSAVLHVFLSYQFNFLWCNNGGNAIDGGPLGFLTWSIPTIIGTLACDAVVNAQGRAPLVKLSFAAIFLMLLGYGFSCGTRLYDLSRVDLVVHKRVMRISAAGKLSDAEAELKKAGDELKGDRPDEEKGLSDEEKGLNDEERSAAYEQIKLMIKPGLIRISLSEELAAIQKALEAPHKKIKEMTDELDGLKKKELVKRLDDYRKKEKEELSRLPEWIVLDREKRVVDQAEAEFKADGWPNPKIADTQAAIDKYKSEFRLKSKETVYESKINQSESAIASQSDAAIATDDADKFEQKDVELSLDEAKARIRTLAGYLKYDFPDLKLAPDPVWPSQDRIAKLKTHYAEQGPKAVLVEPPFVAPPADDKRVASPPPLEHRRWNYWMMSQRAGTISYLTFAAGFNLLAYVLFYILGDMAGVKVGVFRTFGMNALAGYIAHDWTGGIIKGFMPGDCPAWYMWGGFALFFFLTWLFVRTLEKQKIYLRL